MLKPLTVWITANCGKIFKRWEYETTLPASWETCMQVKKEQLEPDMEQQTGSKLGRGVHQGCILPFYLFNFYAEYIWHVRLDESQAGIKISGRNIPQICRWHHPNGRKWGGTKEPLNEGEEESEKAGLKLDLQKTKIMASGPITSWQIDGETMETVTGFIFLGSKITADGDCSHDIKRCLLFGRKVMTNLDSILKSRDMTLLTKVHIVKAMVYPVVMYGCGNWTLKKGESQRIDAFELWCWRRLLRVPWTSRRSN